MSRRTVIFIALSLALALATAATAAARGAKASAATTVTVSGPYARYDEQSFRAVLAGFHAAAPDVTPVFNRIAATDDASLMSAVKAGNAPDLAVLRLPDQMPLLRSLVAAKALQPIGFVSPALDADYAYTWKTLGAVDGTLYALPFKVENRSAFWYDTALFKRAGLEPPHTWLDFQATSKKLLSLGIKPLAIGGGDGQSLAQVFANVFLTQQGPAAYDKLAAHQIAWTSPAVKGALKETAAIVRPGALSRKIAVALSSDFTAAAMQLLGAPPKTAMLFGGSNVLTVLRDAAAARPAASFGSFAFPTIGKPPARIIGSADVVVMLKETPASRALLGYLATPAAATIWAKRGGFLSPNAKVAADAYAVAANRSMAKQLTSTTVFRLDLAGQFSPAFRSRLDALLRQYVRGPAQLDSVAKQLEAAAKS